LLLHLNSDFTDSSLASNPTFADSYNGGTPPAITTSDSVFGSGCAEFFDLGYIDTGNPEVLHFGTGDFTVECWIKFSSLGSYPAIFGPDVGYCNSFFVVMNSDAGTVMVGPQCAGWVLQAAHTMYTDTWYHLAITRSSGTLRCFQNGVLLASASDSTGFTAPVTACIGGAKNAGNSLLGFMDEVRVVKGMSVYDTDFTVPASPLSPLAATGLPDALGPIAVKCPPAPEGTLLFTACVSGDWVGTYADGLGGRYIEVLSAGSC
jgi:hypothetical protein